MEIGGFKALGIDFTEKDILEVGCWSGYSASLIVKDHPKSYTGMDIMPEQLEKAEALQLPGARFVRGDAADLGRFGDGSFDMIVDFMILHHVEGWRRFLDEAFRVLRPGRAVSRRSEGAITRDLISASSFRRRGSKHVLENCH